jgi:hypothetical protein
VLHRHRDERVPAAEADNVSPVVLVEYRSLFAESLQPAQFIPVEVSDVTKDERRSSLGQRADAMKQQLRQNLRLILECHEECPCPSCQFRALDREISK